MIESVVSQLSALLISVGVELTYPYKWSVEYFNSKLGFKMF